MKLPLPEVETYRVGDHEVYVVRDGLTSAFPGPNNSKVRGLHRLLTDLREKGVKIVASQDTRISRIGWGVSWLCNEMDMTHINFYPDAGKKGVPFYQRMSEHHGGRIIPIRGTYSSAMRSIARKYMLKERIKAHFIPIGASTVEAVYENARALLKLPEDMFEGSLVVSVSSGTIAAGLLYGCALDNYKTSIYGVLASSFKGRREKIYRLMRKAGTSYFRPKYGSVKRVKMKVIDLRYGYSQKEEMEPPFPCDVYLDRKAWKFLVNNVDELEEPITFWNVGGEWDPIKGLTNNLRGDGLVTKEEVERFV